MISNSFFMKARKNLVVWENKKHSNRKKRHMDKKNYIFLQSSSGFLYVNKNRNKRIEKLFIFKT